MLGDIQIAREYFDAFLPNSLKEVIDLESLDHTPVSFISENLQETMADIVFKCPLKANHNKEILYLSLLFEHRSTEYKYVSIQLGGYLYDAYRKQLKNNDDSLIPVIPFLYYHGNTKWNPKKLNQIFDKYPSTILQFIPEFRFLYENIQNYTDDQIRQLSEGLLASSLLIQKYAFKPDELVKKFQDIFLILESWGQRNLFEAIIVYFYHVSEVDEHQLNELLTQIPEAMKTEFVSLADRLTQKGLQKGLQEGLQKGLQKGQLAERDRKNRQATENMLRKGFDVPVICDVLEVTPEYVENIRAKLTKPNDPDPADSRE